MKITEFLTESSIDPGIVDTLLRKGYSKLGIKGADQQAFLEPGTGLVLKIFGTDYLNGHKKESLTDAQLTFKAFADFCMANPNNSCLPQFFGWERFMWTNHHYYLQIRMERLFEFTDKKWAYHLQDMANFIKYNNKDSDKVRFFDDFYGNDDDAADQLSSHMGEEKLNLLWDTIVKLDRVARQGGFALDLHSGNFMLGSDGEIVISDPFWSGTH